jgi:hypothetical protein
MGLLRFVLSQVSKARPGAPGHLDKLLDPDNDKVQLDTVQRAAMAVGRRIRLVLV